jgi:hypothetical protein
VYLVLQPSTAYLDRMRAHEKAAGKEIHGERCCINTENGLWKLVVGAWEPCWQLGKLVMSGFWRIVRESVVDRYDVLRMMPGVEALPQNNHRRCSL